MTRSTSSRRAVLRGALVVGLAGAAVFTAAPVAGAATLAQEGDTLVYRAAPGERNATYLAGSWDPEGRLRFSDITADITDLPGTCTRRAIDMVDCDVPGRVRVELGDGDDSVGFSESYAFALPVEVHGGDGSDRLDGNHYAAGAEHLDGGPGKDRIDGFGGDDMIVGGTGDDDIEGNAGSDQVLGGDGNDTLAGDDQAAPGADLIDGGAGSDIVKDYVEYGTDIHPPADVSLDGAANDGRAGEGDNVVGVERFVAYVSGRFVLTDGAEDWQVWSNMNSGASVVLAGGGDDKITGEDAVETIDGGAGNDTLEGGKNHDTITGGPGADLIYADETTSSCNEAFPESCVRYGNDVVNARDGEVDGIDCGAGTDRVVADPADVVAQNCETVERAAAPGPGPVPGPGNDPTGPLVVDGPQTAGPRLSVDKRRLRAALSRGLVVRVAGAKPGKLTLRVRHGRRVVARGTARIGSKGTGQATVRFTRAARRALRGKRNVTLRLTAGARTETLKLVR